MAKFLKFFMPIITVVALALAGFMYYQVMQLRKSPQAAAVKETKDVVAKVSKLVALPADETPTIATVSDPAALKDQPFFVNALKGDKVLIYTNAKKAVLYSVTMNKILDIAPLNIGNTGTVTKSTTVTPPAAPATTTTAATPKN